jgi:integrase
MRTPRLCIGTDGTRTWKVRYRDGARQSSRTFADERGATRFAGWIERYGVNEALGMLRTARGVHDDEHTVASWCADRVARLSGITTGTRADYSRYVRRDLGALADLPLSSVTADAVAAWVTAMETAGASGKTIANKHGFLSARLTEAVTAGLILSNPAKGTRLPKSIRAPMVFLSHDEFTRFLGCFADRWVPLVEVLFATGMRWGEITALQCGDVDLDAGTASIVRAWKRGDGKPVLGPPKTSRSRRTIALAPETVTVLRPLMDGRPGDAWVFTNGRGDHVRGPAFHTTAWQPAVALANGVVPERSTGRGRPRRIAEVGRQIPPLTPPLGKRPRIHDARHSCASWLIAAGLPLNVVQAHLGHESITTTVDRYSHLMPSAQGHVRAALSAALSQSRPELLPPSPA